MRSYVIRDPARVRGQWAITAFTLLLLSGYAVLRQYVGPQESVPATMYMLIGALVVAWGVFSVRVRAIVLRINEAGIATARAKYPWSEISRASAHGGELVVVAGGERQAIAFPPERTAEVNDALRRCRPDAPV